MVGLRLKLEEIAALQKFRLTLRERASEAGCPEDISLAALLRLWIIQRLQIESEFEELGPKRQVRTAPHVQAALKKLRDR